MDIWQKAKIFAEEAAKRTQTIASPAMIAEVFSETAKKSMELAAEASKKAEGIRAVADQGIKSLADQLPSTLSLVASDSHSPSELEKFGVTDDLIVFVKGLTLSTFHNFPISDGVPVSDDVQTVSNVRQDLTEWQQRHASLVLDSVKEISKLRYELCPRHMKDRRFWRIYFTLVSTHVAPYEKKYMEEIELTKEQTENDTVKKTDDPHAPVTKTTNKNGITSTSSAEQDIDTFLLGDLDSDVGPDDGNEPFDDDFDKIDNSDVEDEKQL
ncbi:uncharacterized protein LOC127796671 [Diospyros lotus]|uniref:uncharacterized protein LOC127796671 n=1 Tax=Diospyros lotus TaxID=55363 RepID=UPI002259B9FC|nr:uncharacterized protein LOC127796671 [Diospyros lotus]